MVAVSYPGVYIEEVQSAVRTVTGVATSITAFVGRALRGPTNEPRLLTSIADFQRDYGGLWTQSPMAYAVHQFYQNGGALALIVRLVHTPDPSETPPTAPAQRAKLGVATGKEEWTFQATHAGVAGSALAITISHPVLDPVNAGRFDVTIFEGGVEKDVALVDVVNLQPGQALGAQGLITLGGETVPPVRPDQVTLQQLAGGVDADYATVTIDGVRVFSAATIGTAGSHLAAVVEEPTSPTGEYNLRVELLDDDGDLLASARFEDVVAGSPWPEPTREGTSDNLIDTRAPAPPRPNADRATFASGKDFEKASTIVGVTVSSLPLEAANEGAWGNGLEVAFDDETSEDRTLLPDDREVDYDLFNLTVREVLDDDREVARETFRNVSLDPDHARFVQRVLAEESSLVVLPGTGPWVRPVATPADTWLPFVNGHDGEPLQPADYLGTELDKNGICALEKADLFNLLIIPPPVMGGETDVTVWQSALAYCKRRRAILLVDAPTAWKDAQVVEREATGTSGFFSDIQGADATNAAIYWPMIKVADPLREYRIGDFTPSGAVAGVISRTDAERGVWKAPAGVEASLSGVRGLSVSLTDLENGRLNPHGINVLRSFPGVGTVAWGARTLRGSDKLANQWKYLPVRRLALFIEESLYRGTQWAVFEPNDEPLWAQLRLNIGAFMQNLFRQGAFQGSAPREAYLVKCDRETTTQNDIDRGIVNIMVGFAPLKPAEFVVVRISQIAGQ